MSNKTLIRNNKFEGNQASSGGGLLINSINEQFNLEKTIIWGNVFEENIADIGPSLRILSSDPVDGKIKEDIESSN